MIDTLIEWAHHTLNWWWGCSKVSEACRHCYAETMAKLFGKGRCVWGPNGLRWVRENAVRDALKIVALAAKTPERQRVFVNSMSDTFEDHPGLVGARRQALCFMEAHAEVEWLLLTKRPENVLAMAPAPWHTDWPSHIWIGTTVENQAAADERIPHLLAIPAKVRFLSCEPLLEAVNLECVRGALPEGSEMCMRGISHEEGTCDCAPGVDWVICGGESGPGARPMHPDWARSLRDQCIAAGVPFFFKQWGEWAPYDRSCNDGALLATPKSLDEPLGKFGKKLAGRLLDGCEWNEVPKVA